MASLRLRFPCSHCQKLLSASTKKIGTQVKCPKCKTVITVPDEHEAARQMASRSASQSGVLGHAAPQHQAYDDEIEVVYEGSEAELEAAGMAMATLAGDKVAVSRRTLYMQGVLLLVAALGAFAFGVYAGRTSLAPKTDPTLPPGAVVLRGKVIFQERASAELADFGAVALVVPQDERPAQEERLRPEGLRPEDEFNPEQPPPGVAAISTWGGDYTRAGGDGSFTLQVPEKGEYFVLLISKNMKRRTDERIAPDLLETLRRYFQNPEELIGDNKFHWQPRNLQSNVEVTYKFDRN